ncbi:MAG: nitrite reductase [Planctomycetaceae bacterium]|jgi:nitrite reductase (NADH) small subunit/3-phenylpropionate/trans-cinnamate dioxygenase ferredoxin subunit|nr:nitrite reductase [Planctomycetaceae bacterium]MDP7277026.1 Rieske (2Fe-2S) protein [Planctomycetaceae bacterium]
MDEFHTVAKTADVPEGEGRAFSVAGRAVAVFRRDGQFHAINDICPHMGASLATGAFEGDQVFCPWHAWRFCVVDGQWLDNPNATLKTDCYEVRVVGDEIQVGLPGDPQPAPSEQD